MKRIVLTDKKTNVEYVYDDSFTAAKAVGKSYTYVRALLKGKLIDPDWTVAYYTENKKSTTTRAPEQSTLMSVIDEFFNS